VKTPLLSLAALSALALLADVTTARAQKMTAQDSAAAIAAGEHAPLAPMAGRKLVVVPTAYLLEADPMGWAIQIQDEKQYLADFDAELAFALADRGLKNVWVMYDKLPREYKRNPDYMADPYHLSADFLRFPGPKKAIPYMPDPLASQLRSITAMNDKAEFVLFPIEIRFIPSESGKGGRAALRAAVIDPRRLTTLWMADVYSDDEEKFTPALLTSLAEHLANLFAKP
jgi:hypothetical protein